MRIYIMRHGEAETFAPTDAERPLTGRGQQHSEQMALQLASQLADGLDLVWVSPYLRAQQTWQVMARHLPAPEKLMTVDEITPYGQAEDVAAYLKAMITVEQPQTVLIVSHLPLVGYLAAELVPDLPPPMYRTSAIAVIDYQPAAERAEFLWQANPEG